MCVSQRVQETEWERGVVPKIQAGPDPERGRADVAEAGGYAGMFVCGVVPVLISVYSIGLRSRLYKQETLQ